MFMYNSIWRKYVVKGRVALHGKPDIDIVNLSVVYLLLK